jgi:putative transposase
MAYDPAVHHRRSTRLTGYDYSAGGAYFVTICVEDRQCKLGRVEGGNVVLSATGAVVAECWEQLNKKYADVELDQFVVMPNHFHAIIGLCPSVGAGSPRPVSLGQIMGFYKYETTKRVNEAIGTPGAKLWQRGYFDHVIRTDRSLEAIREYIFTNPSRWSVDGENPAAANRVSDLEWLRGLDSGSGIPVMRGSKGGETPPLREGGTGHG